ncbi:thioredoxin family protein [Leeuwenhoekiella marinoflava]|uniref:thioredoxin family protein n=1 Tax=Leeuwenhoekiella marinoflava TaxID=988 RepID=UPI003003590E
MKRYKLSLFALALSVLISCKSKSTATASGKAPEAPAVAEAPEKPEAPTVQQPQMLTGETERRELQTGTFGSWFNPRYEEYDINKDVVLQLKPLLEDVDIIIFMGTWCGDSKRETPRFYKILDAAGKKHGIELITVDRSKTTPEGLESGKDIKRVPTLIFSKNGEELGRIVEYPIESLEKDMLKILQGKPYKHAYAD